VIVDVLPVDQIIWAWLHENPLTCLLVYGALKIMAKRSPTTLDDSILTMIGGALRIDRRWKQPSGSSAEHRTETGTSGRAR
jgi:hypothetical protein